MERKDAPRTDVHVGCRHSQGEQLIRVSDVLDDFVARDDLMTHGNCFGSHPLSLRAFGYGVCVYGQKSGRSFWCCPLIVLPVIGVFHPFWGHVRALVRFRACAWPLEIHRACAGGARRARACRLYCVCSRMWLRMRNMSLMGTNLKLLCPSDPRQLGALSKC